MNYDDMQNLAVLLDKNRAFSRPDDQMTGYSLQEHTSQSSNLTRVSGAGDSLGSRATQQGGGGPAGIVLPPAVVDAQLGLPRPSHGKDTSNASGRSHRDGGTRTRPSMLPRFADDDAMWTQEELRARMRQPLSVVSGAAHQSGVIQPQCGAATWSGGAEDDVGASAGVDGEEPEYTILFQQKVTAEDVYLGVDFTHDSSSASSDGIVVRVKMPLVTALADIALHVAPYELRVRTTHYRLTAPLMRRVVESRAAAKWDKEHKTLTVVLPIDEEERKVKVLM